MAPPRRFFAPEAARATDIRLAEPESHRLLRVLRLGAGTEVELFDGRGNAYAARFVEVDAEGRCRLRRGAALSPREPARQLTVGLALPKGDGFTQAARQLAEIGAVAVTPLVTARSEGAASPSRLARWRAAALSGSRQCGRAVVPAVTLPVGFGPWIAGDLPRDRWIASPRAPGAAPPEPSPARRPGASVLAIGPEGGFDAAELRDAVMRGFVPLDLGERVLRTGTAAVVAAAALLGSPGSAARAG